MHSYYGIEIEISVCKQTMAYSHPLNVNIRVGQLFRDANNNANSHFCEQIYNFIIIAHHGFT